MRARVWRGASCTKSSRGSESIPPDPTVGSRALSHHIVEHEHHATNRRNQPKAPRRSDPARNTHRVSPRPRATRRKQRPARRNCASRTRGTVRSSHIYGAKKRCAGASADSQERTVSWHGRVHGLKMGEQDPVRVAGSSVCWPVRAVRELEQEEHKPAPRAGVTSSREPWHRPPPLPRGTAHAAGATVQLVGFLAIPRGRTRAQGTSGSAPRARAAPQRPHSWLSRAAGVQRPIESIDVSPGQIQVCVFLQRRLLQRGKVSQVLDRCC